ncbi:unnamed protein product [Rotaria socialis]|uniref:WWE domain-containing protein n=1 Tax=Rotaria socialis TaxID=392032 RepID=A0A818AS82_9BILA|nr:unnamed protein product [Rotaria socialis]CAF4736116.1 unnamed protein product [Rotaria socialis]
MDSEKSSTEQGCIRWRWKSKDNASGVKKDYRWKQHTDIENRMIEHAYQQGNDQVELDDFTIDFRSEIQISKRNSQEQYEIKRQIGLSDISDRVRVDRFVVEEAQCIEKSFYSLPKSFMNAILFYEGQVGPERVLEAIAGIRKVGALLGKAKQAECLANDFQETYGIYWGREDEIMDQVIRLYTMDNFLYKFINYFMRTADITTGAFENERDKMYGQLLGPYYSLLQESFHRRRSEVDILLYRSANLTDDMIEEYKQYVGEDITWISFSSSSKNKAVALLYDGNTLFQIYVPKQPDTRNADVSSLSQFPEEEEVVFDHQTFFTVKKVDYDQTLRKHIIHLNITDYGARYRK